MPDAIQIRGLVKTFGHTRALDGVDLTVQAVEAMSARSHLGASPTLFVRC
jgi:hypothetical protein